MEPSGRNRWQSVANGPARKVRRLAQWADELGLVRLSATVELTNSASKRVLKRAQFAHAGTARQNRVLRGKPIDEDLYVLELSAPGAGNRER